MQLHLQSIKFVVTDKEEWPDPIGTYWTDPEKIMAYAAALDPGQSLVINHDLSEIDLTSLGEVLEYAVRENRDVVIKIPSA